MDDLRNFFTIPGWYQPLSPFTFETKFVKLRTDAIAALADSYNSGTDISMDCEMSKQVIADLRPVMKKISGNLRLDLAQYNELKAFTQFGSDLDAATKATLDRGARVMEMLKQAQYSPMPVEDQVAIIYAVSKGYTDDIAVNKIGAFEAGLLNFMKSSSYKASVLDVIANTGKLEGADEEALVKAITEFKATFQA